MAGHIPSSGSISMGPAAGDTRSIYRLRNLKRSTGDSSQQSLSNMRDWYRTYVGPAGDPSDNMPGSGNQVSFSDFHNHKVWRVAVRAQTETPTQYTNNNDAELRIYGSYGSSDYYFTCNGSTQHPSGSTEVYFSSMDSGTNYTVTCSDEGGTDAIFYLTYNPGYGGGSHSIIGSTTSGANGTHYYWSTKSSSSWSEYSYFYVEEADPSGTAYG